MAKKITKKKPTIQSVLTALETMDTKLTESISSMNNGLTLKIGRVEERLDAIETKLDFVASHAVTRQQFRNLMAELRTRGIDLDESKILAV